MKLIKQHQAIGNLKRAFRSRNLTLYLGAGVSIASGLPSWEQLVLLMYFRTLNADINMSVYSNYLLAIAEWVLEKKKEPLDVIIRKIKASGWDDDGFLKIMRESLYAAFMQGGRYQVPEGFLNGNTTLNSIVKNLCSRSSPIEGLRSIITYNYDDLLELGLRDLANQSDFQVIYNNTVNVGYDKIPIYHVHGYLPINGQASTINELIFSEDQYNNVYQDAYFWGNMVQMQNFSSQTGLMIGISLSDRNVRRILDAIRRSPIPTKNYLLLKKTVIDPPMQDSEDMKFIKARARENLNKLERSGIKSEGREYSQVKETIESIFNFESETFDNIYKGMGLDVLLFDDYSEIPDFIKLISEE